MSFKKTDQIIEELEARLFIVEGEVTDLLTRETMQNLNTSTQSATGAIAVGSALAGQIGNAALASFAASDEGIEVSAFAVEITDKNQKKHVFKGCFPEVVFKKSDVIKLIVEANPYDRKYDRVTAVIDQKHNYIWTSQQIIKGRMRYRIWGMKIGGIVVILSIIIFITFFLFLEGGYLILLDPLIWGIFTFCIILFIFGGWNIGSSFDEQSIELEAILRKLGFYKPSMASLNNYSVFAVNRKNKIKMDEYPDRWEQYTYRIDLAQQADKEKYGKSAK